MTENYVKLSDIASSLFKCEYTIGPDPSCTGRIVPSNWLADLPVVELDSDKTVNDDEPSDLGCKEERKGDEKEAVEKEVVNKTGLCPFYMPRQVLDYGADGVPDVTMIGHCKREADKGNARTLCQCAGRKIACPYSAQTRREGIAEEMSPDEKERMYWIRTHMTSISRYLNNNNPKHTEEYKRLAKTAAKSILRMVNGGVWDDEH